jgi:hypothetical protein
LAGQTIRVSAVTPFSFDTSPPFEPAVGGVTVLGLSNETAFRDVRANGSARAGVGVSVPLQPSA